MNWWELARLFVCGTAWRATSWERAGSAVTQALRSNDETVRTLAGMFLVKAGSRAEPLLRAELGGHCNARQANTSANLDDFRACKHIPAVIGVLGSIGNSATLPLLRRLAKDQDAHIAKAAREAMDVIAFANHGRSHGTGF